MPPPPAGSHPDTDTDPDPGPGADAGADPVARLQRLLAGPGRRRDAPAATAWTEVLRGRWSLPLTAGLAVLVLAAVVAALLALRAVTTAPAAAPPAAPLAASAPPGAAAPTAASGVAASPVVAPPPAAAVPGAALPASTAPEVVVDVEGRVPTPGLVRLPAGSRVDDAVRAAGGPGDSADLTRLNLARPLVDGEQVLVPAPGDPAPPPAPAAGTAAGAPPPAAAGPVPLATATLADLDALPGVGPVLAQRILDWRTQHGGFSSVDELGEVSGIGDVLMERLRPLVVV
jgi:competence protein ComEA